MPKLIKLYALNNIAVYSVLILPQLKRAIFMEGFKDAPYLVKYKLGISWEEKILMKFNDLGIEI